MQFDAVLVDYLHKRKFPVLGPLASWSLRAATVAVLVGVYQFNTNDIGEKSSNFVNRSATAHLSIGLTELITKVWAA